MDFFNVYYEKERDLSGSVENRYSYSIISKISLSDWGSFFEIYISFYIPKAQTRGVAAEPLPGWGTRWQLLFDFWETKKQVSAGNGHFPAA